MHAAAGADDLEGGPAEATVLRQRGAGSGCLPERVHAAHLTVYGPTFTPDRKYMNCGIGRYDSRM